ncbi:MAG: PIN domain-containing protein [Euryarchaeota archaeon]|nr:PIN domain-containing protein [Euryarchaeota archaeon]
MAVLDTTFLIDLERRWPSAIKTLDDLESYAPPLRVPAAVWVEYLSAMEPTKRDRAQRHLEEITTFEPLSKEMAQEASRLQFEMGRVGRPLAWGDLQVAATALHVGEGLVSNDQVFRGVPGLSFIEY